MKISSQIVKAALCTCVVVGLFAGPAVARVIRGEIGDFLPGADVDGNLDFNNGGEGVSKLFKYTRSGIIINIARGRVTNESGRTVIVRDFACNVADPEDENPIFLIPATRTRQVITRRSGEGRARNRAVCIFNPRRVEDRQVN